MATSVKTGQVTTETATGNKAYTGLGFQPKLVIFYSTLATGDTVFSPSYGVAASSSARWSVANISGTGSGQVLTARLFTSTKAFVAIGLTGAVFLAFDFVSMDADGFTVNYTTAPGPGFPVNYLAIGGSDVSVTVGTVDSNTATGNQAVTGAGFQPKAVVMCSCDAASGDGTGYTGDANLSLGFGTSSSARAEVSLESLPASTSNAYGVLNATKIWTLLSGGTAYGEADLVSLDADGFTFNITTAPGVALRLGYVALGGTAQFAIGTFAQPGSTGNQGVTGVGFTPSAVLFLSGGKAANNTVTDHARLMVGAAVSSAERGVMWSAVKDATDSASNPSIRILSTALSQKFTADDATTVLAESDFVSQDADGFTNNWTTADATARLVAYLAIGAAGGGGGGGVIPVLLNLSRQRGA